MTSLSLTRLAYNASYALVIANWHALAQTLALLGVAYVISRKTSLRSSPAARRKLWLWVGISPLLTVLLCGFAGTASRFGIRWQWLFPSYHAQLIFGAGPPASLATLGFWDLLVTIYGWWLACAGGIMLVDVMAGPVLVRFAHANCPTGLAAQFSRLASESGLCRARLGISDCIDGPCVAGIWRPTVLMPSSMVHGSFGPAEWEAILRHEFAHVRAWDNLVLLGEQLVKALFPLSAVWLVQRWLHRDMEAACDMEAVSRGQLQDTQYARLLLQVASSRHRSPLAAAFWGSAPGALEMRHRLHAIFESSCRPVVRRLPVRYGSFFLAAMLLTSSPLLAAAASLAGRRGSPWAALAGIVPTVQFGWDAADRADASRGDHQVRLAFMPLGRPRSNQLIESPAIPESTPGRDGRGGAWREPNSEILFLPPRND